MIQLVKTVSYDQGALKLIIEGELQSFFSDSFALVPSSGAFYLRFNDLVLSDFMNIVGTGDLSSSYPGDYILNEAEHLIIIDGQKCAPLADHSGKGFDETIYLRDRNILILVVGSLNITIDPKSIHRFRIEIQLARALPDKYVPSLDFSPTDVSYPMGYSIDFGGESDSQNVSNFKVYYEEMLYLFNGIMELPCYTSNAYFIIRGETDQSEQEVPIRSLTEGSEIKCTSGFHRVQKVFKFPVNKEIDLIVFMPQTIRNEECAFVPYRPTTLTPAHYVQVGPSVFKAEALQKLNNKIIAKKSYIDYIYHIHVDFEGYHTYAYCNGMPTDVWGNLNTYTKTYAHLSTETLVPTKLI